MPPQHKDSAEPNSASSAPAPAPRKRGRPPGPNPTPRGHLAVKAGLLRPKVEAAAKASGLSLSDWLKRAIVRELAIAGLPAVNATAPQPRPLDPTSRDLQPLITPTERDAQTAGTRPPGKPLRLQLDPPTAERLEAYRQRGHFRSRPAALRFALHAATAADAIDVAPLAAAVAALIKASADIGPIGNNLNQIARALNAAVGQVGQRELDHLNIFMPEVQRHLARASQVAHLLDAFITPQRPKKAANR